MLGFNMPSANPRRAKSGIGGAVRRNQPFPRLSRQSPDERRPDERRPHVVCHGLCHGLYHGCLAGCAVGYAAVNFEMSHVSVGAEEERIYEGRRHQPEGDAGHWRGGEIKTRFSFYLESGPHLRSDLLAKHRTRNRNTRVPRCADISGSGLEEARSIPPKTPWSFLPPEMWVDGAVPWSLGPRLVPMIRRSDLERCREVSVIAG